MGGSAVGEIRYQFIINAHTEINRAVWMVNRIRDNEEPVKTGNNYLRQVISKAMLDLSKAVGKKKPWLK